MRETIMTAFLSLLFFTALTGCRQEDKQMDLNLEDTSLVIPSYGGEYTVKYSAENITDDVIMEFEGVPAWIENIQAVPDSGIISLTVEKSMETAYRRSDIRIFLGENSSPATLSLTQKAAFTIIVHEDSTTSSKLHWDIIPEDKTMTFWSNARPQNYMDEHNTDSLLHERELFAIEGWAKTTGIPLAEYLSYITTPGDRLNVVYEGLAHDTEYTIFAYGMNGEGERTTDIYKATTQTLSIQPSDNRITLNMGEITSRTATYSTSVTNDDYYCQGYDYAEDYEGMSDEEILHAIMVEGKPVLASGKGFGDGGPFNLTGLRPNTEYMIFAFGLEQDVITTDLVKTTFRTLEEEKSDVTAELVFDKYFHYGDLEPDNPDRQGWALVPTWIETTGDVASYSYIMITGDYSDPSEYSDEELIEMCFATDPEQLWTVRLHDGVRTLIAVARDKEGRYGPVFRRAYLFTLDECSPIEEFDSDYWLDRR